MLGIHVSEGSTILETLLLTNSELDRWIELLSFLNDSIGGGPA